MYSCKLQIGRKVNSDRHSMNNHLSSSKKPIVEFRKKILNPKNTPVQDIFTEVNDRHFWLLSWLDPGEPALGKRWKVIITFHPTNSRSPGYIGFSLYMVLVPARPVTLTSVESNLPTATTQTTPKDARLRSAATWGCFETCFGIFW
jgi:hypothetical protein